MDFIFRYSSDSHWVAKAIHCEQMVKEELHLCCGIFPALSNVRGAQTFPLRIVLLKQDLMGEGES